MREATGFDFEYLAQEKGFLVVYPQGYKRSWNLGEEESDADDIEFVNMIVEKLKSYSGINQEIINLLINNSGLDRKVLFNEIEIHTMRLVIVFHKKGTWVI